MNENEMRFSRPPRPEAAPGEKKVIPFPLFKKVLKVLVIMVILAVIVLVAFWGKGVLEEVFNKKGNAYSAVFLSNGQVYFGKMVENNKSEIVLNDVYYLQINENATKEEITNAINQAHFSLIKLGQELHGPTDELFINKSQVSFYEHLRDDSKLLEAIKQFKN